MSQATLMKSHQHGYLSKGDRNRHADMDDGKLIRSQPFTKSYRQLMNTKSCRSSLPRGRAQELDTQNQMV